MNFMVIMSFITVFFSCSKGHEKEVDTVVAIEDATEYESKPAEYVYLDDNDVIHTNIYCFHDFKDVIDNRYRNYALRRIDITTFVIHQDVVPRMCAHCVDDDEYKRLMKISDRNYAKKAFPHTSKLNL